MTTPSILFALGFAALFVGASWLLRNYRSPRVTQEDLAVLDVKACQEDHQVVRVSPKIFNRDDARRNTGRVEIYVEGKKHGRLVYHQELYPASVRKAMGMKSAKS